MALELANVVNPESLTHYAVLTESVELDAATPLVVFKAIAGDGAYPADANERVKGIILYFSEDGAPDKYATVITEGVGILQVEPGQTIAVDQDVAINANGNAIAAASGNAVLGMARNASAGSTAQVPHYIRVKVNQVVAA